MVWFRVDDGFCDHPKVEALLEGKHAGDAIALWTLAGSWCGKHLTDGEISAAKVARLGIARHENAAAELVRVRLWEKTATGFRFHDWREFQSSRENVELARAETAERVRRYRDNRREKKRGAPSEMITESGNVTRYTQENVTHGERVSNASPNVTRNTAHTIPFHSVPIRTKEENQTSAEVEGQRVVVDSSFNVRVMEAVVSETRGTVWSVPTQRMHLRQRANEVAEEIRDMATKLDIDCKYLCAEAFKRWVQVREKRNQDTAPHWWLEDWAGALPPPPKPKEVWRDLEG